MVRLLAAVLSRWSARWVPDPFVIAILLTTFTLALTTALTEHGPLAAIGFWGGRLKDGSLLPKELGLWKLLGFGMQVCLTLVTGHALASAKVVQRGIRGFASLARTPPIAIVLTCYAAMVAGYINWALGLIVGALVAREIGREAQRRGLRVDYPLLGAAGYTGLLVWHGGLSGTAPLKVTQQAEIKDILSGVELQPIPLTETLLSGLNLTVGALLMIGVPALLVLMSPAEKDARGIDQFDVKELPAEPDANEAQSPAQRLSRSRWGAWLLAALLLTYLGLYLQKVGVAKLDLNSVNLIFLSFGLLLYADPKAYSDAITEGAQSCGGVILQYPLYAGIMGLMALSGLMTMLAQQLVAVSSPTTFPVLTFFSAGLVNLLVPSGGGQWAVQGPVIVKAAHELGVPMGKAIMAFCYGDQWTNMLQPFWALPLLGITGLKAGDLIGYTATLMLLVAPLVILPLLIF